MNEATLSLCKERKTTIKSVIVKCNMMLCRTSDQQPTTSGVIDNIALIFSIIKRLKNAQQFEYIIFSLFIFQMRAEKAFHYDFNTWVVFYFTLGQLDSSARCL